MPEPYYSIHSGTIIDDGIDKVLKYAILDYKFTEQPTGRTDENGNDTYEISVSGNTGGTVNVWNNFGPPISNFLYPVKIVRASCKNSAGSTIFHGTVTINASFSVAVSSAGQVQEYHEGTQYNNEPCIATIEYTKV